MRRDGTSIALPATVVVIGLLAGACGSAEEPAASSATEKVAREFREAEADAGGAEPEADPEPQPDPSKPHLEITARDIAFDTDRLVAPAGEAFQIVLSNEDAMEHNLSIYDTLNGVTVFAHPLFRGEMHRGPGTIIYDVPPLEAGRFVFWCDAHLGERMTGKFVLR